MGWWQDVKFALRLLLKNPRFTVVAVLTMALGIGATTAVFSVVSAILLEPLPYGDSQRLVTVEQHHTEEDSLGFVSPLDLRDLRESNHTFESLAAYRWNILNLTGGEGPERLRAWVVSAGFFSTLGVRPALGRGFLPEEDQPGRNQVVVISHGLWQRRFAGKTNILGQTLILDGVPHTVVGVAPPGVAFPTAVDAWSPIAFEYDREPRYFRYAGVVGRLQEGVTLAAARADLDRISKQLEQDHPESNRGWVFAADPLKERIVRGVRPALLILLSAVSFVLLIAAANVTNLLLSRLPARRKEVAIRQALGASRGRLLRQMLTESVLLSTAGGALGLLLAVWGSETMTTLYGENLPRATEIGLNARVLGFALLVTVISGLVFGLAPALQASATRVIDPLRQAGRTAGGSPGSRRLREGLVTVEVALALILLLGASLLVSSFSNLMAIDPGFSGRQVLSLELSLPESRYGGDAEMIPFYREILERVKALPGVVSAGTIHPMPFGLSSLALPIFLEGGAAPGRSEPQAHYRVTGPGYFETFDIPLLEGRFLMDSDSESALPVLVINRSMAARYFPQGSPLGQRISFEDPSVGEPTWYTVVGVVGDVRFSTMESEGEPEVYGSVFQEAYQHANLVVRAQGDPAALAKSVAAAVQQVDPDLPLFNIRKMEDIIAGSLGRPRFSMLLVTLLAAVALALASVGVFGVMSVTVGQQMHEIGIRLALGAPRRSVLRMVLQRGMIPVLIGAGIGLVGALGLSRYLASQLYGVSPTDPLLFTTASLVLVLVGLLAAFLPARRATRIDPLAVLRAE